MKQAVTITGNNSLQKMGGLAALIAAGTFLVAMIIMVAVVVPAGYGSPEMTTLENVAYLAENQNLMYLWNLIAYVIFGGALVVLVLALHDRLKDHSSALAQTAAAFGMIWAGLMFASGMVANIGAGVVVDVFAQEPSQAGPVWQSLQFVVDGLGGGNEIVGGLWLLLLSVAGLRSGRLSKALNYFGLVVSAAGLVTVIPALGEVGAIFGLGSIVWFVWVGLALLRGKVGETAADALLPQHSPTV